MRPPGCVPRRRQRLMSRGSTMTQTVKCRLFERRLRPRRTKLEIPGWGGKLEPRRDGNREQPWHCVPFSESAQYGIEIFYPYDNELRVGMRDGKLVLDGDFGPGPDTGL